MALLVLDTVKRPTAKAGELRAAGPRQRAPRLPAAHPAALGIASDLAGGRGERTEKRKEIQKEKNGPARSSLAAR